MMTTCSFQISGMGYVHDCLHCYQLQLNDITSVSTCTQLLGHNIKICKRFVNPVMRNVNDLYYTSRSLWQRIIRF